MTTLFHSTVESLRARGVSIPDDVDRALQLITANADGKVGDVTFVSAKADPAKLFGEWSEHQKALNERRAQQGK